LARRPPARLVLRHLVDASRVRGVYRDLEGEAGVRAVPGPVPDREVELHLGRRDETTAYAREPLRGAGREREDPGLGRHVEPDFPLTVRGRIVPRLHAAIRRTAIPLL